MKKRSFTSACLVVFLSASLRAKNHSEAYNNCTDTPLVKKEKTVVFELQLKTREKALKDVTLAEGVYEAFGDAFLCKFTEV